MEKNTYSLILINEVVQRIDRLAHTKGCSRSSMINQILAEYVSLLTPQKQVENIFTKVRSQLEEGIGFNVEQTPSGTLKAKSVLSYRYNPTITYTVDISLQQGEDACVLYLGSRTQNEDLRTLLSVFYEIWNQIETGLLEGRLSKPLSSSTVKDRFRRVLQIPRGEGEEGRAGEAIAGYIRLLDSALKLSFASPHGIDIQTFEQIGNLYGEYIEKGGQAI